MTKNATVISVRINATTTHVVWREEHLWNVIVLQRVHISSLVQMGFGSKELINCHVLNVSFAKLNPFYTSPFNIAFFK
jgi:hypothetical protein